MADRNKLSLTSAAVAFGVAKETLRRALARAEVKTGDGATFTIRQCHNALAGDVRGERARLLRAQADKQETGNRIRDGALVELPTAERILWAQLIGPLKQEMDAMPQKLAPLINPENPTSAQKMLFDWVDDTKRKMMKQ
jgi:hypothetical protein